MSEGQRRNQGRRPSRRGAHFGELLFINSPSFSLFLARDCIPILLTIIGLILTGVDVERCMKYRMQFLILFYSFFYLLVILSLKIEKKK